VACCWCPKALGSDSLSGSSQHHQLGVCTSCGRCQSNSSLAESLLSHACWPSSPLQGSLCSARRGCWYHQQQLQQLWWALLAQCGTTEMAVKRGRRMSLYKAALLTLAWMSQLSLKPAAAAAASTEIHPEARLRGASSLLPHYNANGAHHPVTCCCLAPVCSRVPGTQLPRARCMSTLPCRPAGKCTAHADPGAPKVLQWVDIPELPDEKELWRGQ
jgi:hypothetical protein